MAPAPMGQPEMSNLYTLAFVTNEVGSPEVGFLNGNLQLKKKTKEDRMDVESLSSLQIIACRGTGWHVT